LLKVSSSFGVIFSINPRSIPSDSLFKIKDYITYIAKIKDRIYTDTIKSMEHFKNKFKIEYRAERLNKIVKNNECFVTDNIHEQVCNYKRPNLLEMVDECKKPNTDKKLIFKYEHFKENLDREKPRKKENNGEGILNCKQTDLTASNKKNTSTNFDENNNSLNYFNYGSTKYFKFNLNNNSKNSNNINKRKEYFGNEESLKRNIFSNEILSQTNEHVYFNEIRYLIEQNKINKDFDDLYTTQKNKEEKINEKNYKNMIKNINIKKDEFNCYNKKNEIEAYCSFVNNSNLSKHKLAKNSRNKKIGEHQKSSTMTNNIKINNLTENSNNTVKDSILNLEHLKSKLVEENFLSQKIKCEISPSLKYNKTNNTNNYSINSYSVKPYKKNINKTKNIIYNKDKEFYLSSNIKNSKDNSAQHTLGNYSNNEIKKNYSEYDLFDNKFKDKISNFIPFLSEEKKANFIKLKSMRKSLFEEMLKMNKFEEKTKNEKKILLKDVKKNTEKKQFSTLACFILNSAKEKKLNFSKAEKKPRILNEENKQTFLKNTAKLDKKINKINKINSRRFVKKKKVNNEVISMDNNKTEYKLDYMIKNKIDFVKDKNLISKDKKVKNNILNSKFERFISKDENEKYNTAKILREMVFADKISTKVYSDENQKV